MTFPGKRNWFLGCIHSDCHAIIMGPYETEQYALEDAYCGCSGAHRVTMAVDPPLEVPVNLPNRRYFSSIEAEAAAEAWLDARRSIFQPKPISRGDIEELHCLDEYRVKASFHIP